MTAPQRAPGPLGRGEICRLLDVPFSEEQLDAITAPLEPGVIIAGAGTGKTTVMAARVVWLVGSGLVEPDQVLGLTFTRKAAHELALRVRTALANAGLAGDQDGGEPMVSTYDSYAGTLATEHGPRIGVERDLRLVSDAQLYALTDAVVAARAASSPALSALGTSTVVQRVMALSGHMLSHGVSREALHAHCDAFDRVLAHAPQRGSKPYADVRDAMPVVGMRRELLGFVSDLWQAKHHEGVVEFADRTALAARLAQEMSTVGAQQRERYRVVLLDEYQDTSAAQVTMLAGLFSGPDPAGGRGFPVTAVGDPLQSIYEWRGAAVGTMAEFLRRFPRSDGQPPRHYQLATNRRSTPAIRAVANAISAPLRERGGPATPKALEGPGAEDHTAPADQVVVSWHDSREQESAAICRALVQEHAVDGVAWGRMAILTRTNADLARLHADLTAADIPAELVGLGGLLELPEVQQVVSMLRVIHDVTDNTALLRLLTGPRWALGPRDLQVLGNRARTLARQVSEATADPPTGGRPGPRPDTVLMDAVASPGPPGPGALSESARSRCAQLAGELAQLRSHAGEPVADLVARVVRAIGVVPECIAAHGPHGARQVEEFVEAVEAYQVAGVAGGLAGLLAWFDAEIEAGRGLEQASSSGADAVQLLTVHRSKGLEWDVVFLPSLVAGTFPSTGTVDDWTTQAWQLPHELRGDADSFPMLEELTPAGFKEYRGLLKEMQADAERRLGYVAVSRARRRVHLSGHRWRPDTVRPRVPSIFLEVAARVAGAAWPPDDAEETNPYAGGAAVAWPVAPDAERQEAEEGFAQAVVDSAPAGDQADPARTGGDADVGAQQRRWVDQADLVIARAAAAQRLRGTVVPGRLSVSEIVAGAKDPEAFRRAMLRPMPSPPSRAATLGTLFHEWVESRFAEQGMLGLEFEPDEPVIPMSHAPTASLDKRMAADLRHLQDRFVAGMFAERQPEALEVPFAVTLAGRLVRGRIDALYRQPPEADSDLLVVDWKTHRGGLADPHQLALYRLAIAQMYDVPQERIAAGFYYVRADRLDVVDALPTVQQMERQVVRMTDAAST